MAHHLFRTRDTASVEHSYYALRVMIGLSGVLLPTVLFLGSLVLKDGVILDSMSDYYNSVMRDFFVGTLFTLGAVLVSYQGSSVIIEDHLTNIAGVLAFLTALFPCAQLLTLPDHPAFRAFTSTWVFDWISAPAIVSTVHLTSAAGMLAIFGWLSWQVFPRSDEGASTTFRWAPTIFRVLGIAILVFVILCIPAVAAKPWLKAVGGWLGNTPWQFVFEFLALFCFGLSWILRSWFITHHKRRMAR